MGTSQTPNIRPTIHSMWDYESKYAERDLRRRQVASARIGRFGRAVIARAQQRREQRAAVAIVALMRGARHRCGWEVRSGRSD